MTTKPTLLRGLLPGVTDLPPLRGVAVFVVGEQLNPNKTDQDRLACTGTFMLALCSLAGLDDHLTYLRAASMRRNLFQPGQALNGEDAARNAEVLLGHFARYQEHYGDQVKERQVLLCGAWARMAFNMRGEYGRQSMPGGAITWIPHPSGRNRFYNDRHSRERVARLVQLVFAHAL